MGVVMTDLADALTRLSQDIRTGSTETDVASGAVGMLTAGTDLKTTGPSGNVAAGVGLTLGCLGTAGGPRFFGVGSGFVETLICSFAPGMSLRSFAV